MKDPRVRALLLALTFGVLLFGGCLIHREKPPVAGTVAADTGTVLYTGADVTRASFLTWCSAPGVW